MGKVLNNIEIAELLRDVAASYKLSDEKKNRFKIIAYERAADAVEHASSELKDIADEGKLEDVAGIGPSIAQHLYELFKTGKSKHFDSLLKPLPPAMFELMRVPGIGPKTAFKMAKSFNISSKGAIAQLKKIAEEGKISQMEGFGEDSEAQMLKSLSEYKPTHKRHLLPYAKEIADDLIEYLKKQKYVKSVDALGSLRRRASTIGDIDIAAATDEPVKTIEYFCDYPKKSRVIEKGDRSAAIMLPGNVHVDLLVHDPRTYGATLQHFTGSKHHNVKLRDLALKQGLSLSDYGIRAIKPQAKAKLKKFNYDPGLKIYQIPTEKQFYAVMGMDWIPPEMREDTGEIEAALAHKLPKLVDVSDIKADLQIHSSFDIETSHDLGLSSMLEIVKKADSLGYEYVAFTEHNPSQKGHTEAQIVKLLEKKRSVVDDLNKKIKTMKLKTFKKTFNSLEIDSLPDGRLPVPQAGLDTLDFALVSIHSQFRLPKEEQTARVMRALSNPVVKIFAHPTGRKLNEREGAELDWKKIFEKVLRDNQWIEINCDPMRLDLPDMLVREAVKNGVKLTLGTDSHHIDSMDNMPFGISVARRGWAQKGDIINTCSLSEFEKLIEKR